MWSRGNELIGLFYEDAIAWGVRFDFRLGIYIQFVNWDTATSSTFWYWIFVGFNLLSNSEKKKGLT
jgi:hypothetical protein